MVVYMETTMFKGKEYVMMEKEQYHELVSTIKMQREKIEEYVRGKQ